MVHLRKIAAASTFCGWGFGAHLAIAAPVDIAPPPLDVGAGVTGIAVQRPIGQTFMANGDAIHTVGLLLLNLNMSSELLQDHLVTLDLFEGVGFGGPLLTSRTVDADQILGRLLGAQASVDFDLGGFPVKAGQTYSFQLSAETTRFGTVWFSGNPYADGQAILQGQSFSDPDLYFQIRAVPEPHPSLLWLIGLPLVLSAQCVRARFPLRTCDCRSQQ